MLQNHRILNFPFMIAIGMVEIEESDFKCKWKNGRKKAQQERECGKYTISMKAIQSLTAKISTMFCLNNNKY